jgi:hypothetical protein
MAIAIHPLLFASISQVNIRSWEQLSTCANRKAEGTPLLVSDSINDGNRADVLRITIDAHFDTIC